MRFQAACAPPGFATTIIPAARMPTSIVWSNIRRFSKSKINLEPELDLAGITYY